MRYLRYRKNNETKPGVEVAGIIYDISNLVSDITNKTIENLLKKEIDVSTLKKVDAYDKLEVPIDGIKKVICIGLNYEDHAEETGMKIPSEPVYESYFFNCRPK